ncbi:zinc finger protein ZAT1-like, partial [Actinidia eriantha]|uniref:zinc finger protein ZAT1-like n=1 Tax=Actinidia eriantha TaxID=165200 RepID=UPI00258C8FBA
ETCEKVFHSFPALNGRRTSHKKNEDLSEPKRRNVFGSGQALGGHKRSHFVAKIAECLVAKKCGVNLIDFNLPAPIKVDDFSTQLEVSAVSDVESVNSITIHSH